MRPARSTMLRRFLTLVLYCCLIFFISSLGKPPAPEFGVEWSDKINHAGAYGVMLVLAFRAFRLPLAARPLAVQLGAALAFTTLYGMSDEIHQAYVPGRSSELADLVADTVGALLAAAGVLLTIDRPIGRRILGAPAGDDSGVTVRRDRGLS